MSKSFREKEREWMEAFERWFLKGSSILVVGFVGGFLVTAALALLVRYPLPMILIFCSIFGFIWFSVLIGALREYFSK